MTSTTRTEKTMTQDKIIVFKPPRLYCQRPCHLAVSASGIPDTFGISRFGSGPE